MRPNQATCNLAKGKFFEYACESNLAVQKKRSLVRLACDHSNFKKGFMSD